VDPDWTRWDTYLVSREDVALCLAFAVALTLMRYRVQVRSSPSSSSSPPLSRRL
jgi:hypothetical protein